MFFGKNGNINISLDFGPLHPQNRFGRIKEGIFTQKMKKKKNIKLLYCALRLFEGTTNGLFDMPAAWQQDTEQTQTQTDTERI